MSDLLPVADKRWHFKSQTDFNCLTFISKNLFQTAIATKTRWLVLNFFVLPKVYIDTAVHKYPMKHIGQVKNCIKILLLAGCKRMTVLRYFLNKKREFTEYYADVK